MKPTFSSQLPVKNQVSYWRKATNSAFLILLGGGIALGGNYLVNSPQIVASPLDSAKPSPEAEVTAIAPDNSPATGQNFVTNVVNNVGTSVVRINASRTVETQLPAAFNDPFFRRFFGSQLPDLPDKQVQQGTGSGFVVSSDGLILTNSHVVAGADKVTVTLKDGRTLEGKVMGSDSITDLAVVKIEAQDLPAVSLGDSDSLQIGEWAIAIGNPLGLDNTVTTGIISATGRSSSQIGVGDKRIDFIQTDAAINPGNSGGPLLNAKGEVIGINTAIIQNAQGLGFAIPINTAKDIAEQLITNGKVEHPFLGIRMASLTPEIKTQLKNQQNFVLDKEKGVIVVEVMPNSPAAKAGIRAGDVITTLNGEEITTADQVQKAVEKVKAGDRLPLQLSRQGQDLNLDVAVGVLPTN
ncbi:MAG: HhoA/HhoB/HtrA family serine endopeptidase [Pleurocapsa sp.]